MEFLFRILLAIVGAVIRDFIDWIMDRIASIALIVMVILAIAWGLLILRAR